MLRTFSELCGMSVLPPKADIDHDDSYVCFVPKADIPLERQVCAHSVANHRSRSAFRIILTSFSA